MNLRRRTKTLVVTSSKIQKYPKRVIFDKVGLFSPSNMTVTAFNCLSDAKIATKS